MESLFRLLLIDDDAVDRQSIIRAFKQASMVIDITQSATAAEGLQLAATGQYDAVLLDYRLPDQDGFDVLQRLRSDSFDPMAVIMLSNNQDQALSERCLKAGAQDFVLKDEISARRLSRALLQAHQRHAIELNLRQNQEQYRQLAECDPLTGLANRRGFETTVNAAMARARRHQTGLAVLLLDLDNFKTINDTLGHDIGDLLLIEVGERLRARVREGDVLCRLGGDEFVVLTSGLEHEQQAAFLAERLLAAFAEPFRLDSHQMQISTSMGIALLDETTEVAADLLKHADLAMYRAKRDGRNQSRFYSDKLHQMVQYMNTLRHDLQQALDEGQFTLFYQPQVRADDHTLCGVEALLRWQHPRLGNLQPDEFMDLLDDSGNAIRLGNHMLHQACRQFAAWHASAPQKMRSLYLSLNLSRLQLRERSLLRELDQILFEKIIDPQHLVLEIDEQALKPDDGGMAVMLESLKLRGVVLALDNFGSGQASMQQLESIPFGMLKIAPAFVGKIGHGIKPEQLLSGMICLGQALELKVVAKGVEQAAQVEFCRESGCQILQGHYFAPALTVGEFQREWLQLVPVCA